MDTIIAYHSTAQHCNAPIRNAGCWYISLLYPLPSLPPSPGLVGAISRSVYPRITQTPLHNPIPIPNTSLFLCLTLPRVLLMFYSLARSFVRLRYLPVATAGFTNAVRSTGWGFGVCGLRLDSVLFCSVRVSCPSVLSRSYLPPHDVVDGISCAIPHPRETIPIAPSQLRPSLIYPPRPPSAAARITHQHPQLSPP